MSLNRMPFVQAGFSGNCNTAPLTAMAERLKSTFTSSLIPYSSSQKGVKAPLLIGVGYRSR